MKNLNVKKIRVSTLPEAEQVPELMNKENIEYQPIAIVNWPDYPYSPKVDFRIAHTGSCILLHYRVTEASVRAVAQQDGGRVWEDACCEFFVSPEKNEVYYNFECNCGGTLLLNCGIVGKRQSASAETMASVKRWSSLGRNPFEERIGECTWELALVIPVTALFKHAIQQLDGTSMRANFYKCGDLLQTPHFLSWSPIDLPKPCFHCPDFFGIINFEA